MRDFSHSLLLIAGIALLAIGSVYADDAMPDGSDGREIMEEVYKRHQQFPYIYEEQTMVLEDRNGHRDTRRGRRYSRLNSEGDMRFLLLFDYPEEVRGVALLAERKAEQAMRRHIYLPALAEQLIESVSDSSQGHFLGTDFSVEDLSGEVLDDYRYLRRQDVSIDGVSHYVVDVYPVHGETSKRHKLRRHYIRKDIVFITMTEHYDRRGEVARQMSSHDLQAIDGPMWRANLILMEDYLDHHQTLIRIERRVLSEVYVPEKIFSAAWLFENYPYRAVAGDESDQTDEPQGSTEPPAEETTPVQETEAAESRI